MGIAPTFHVPGYSVRRMVRGDIPALQELFERCADHFVLHDGEPPGPDAAEIEFGDVPPGRTIADKHLHGISAEDAPDRLVAVLESVSSYPDPATWFLGLLLVDPEHRDGGIGSTVLRGFESMVSHAGFARVRLAVIRANIAGRRFWERRGYRWEVTRERRPFGALHHDVDVLVHELGL